MMIMHNNVRFGACNVIVACVYVIASAVNANAVDTVTSDHIVARWQERLDKLQSLRVVVEYDTLYPKNSFRDYFDDGRPAPVEDILFSNRVSCWIDLHRPRVRQECLGQSFHIDRGRLVPRHEVRLFDGTNYQQFTPKEVYLNKSDAKAWAELQEFGDEMPQFFDFGVVSLFHALAMLPGRERGVTPAVPKESLDPRLFRVIRSMNNTVVLRTTNLRAPNAPGHPWYLELWVDMDRDAAIVRYSSHRGGYQFKTVEYQFHGETDPRWMPAEWSESSFAEDGSLSAARTARVVSAELNPSLDGIEFQMKAKPGMFVQSVPDRKTYYQLTADVRVSEKEGLLQFQQNRGRLRTYVITAVVIAGLLVLVTTWIRARRP